jgi:eukaryotic-like serine/threonine-protein kinase
MCLLEQKYVPAEKELRICLQWRQRVESDRWPTWNTKSLLGEALSGQGKYDSAEPLLLDGYRGMKQRANKIPGAAAARLPEAAQRLVDLYKAWNRPEQADRWAKTVQKERGLVAAKAVVGLAI